MEKRKTKGTPLRGLFKARRSCKRFEFCLVGILKKKKKELCLSEKFGLLVRGPLYSSPPRREFFFFVQDDPKFKSHHLQAKLVMFDAKRIENDEPQKPNLVAHKTREKKMKSAQETAVTLTRWDTPNGLSEPLGAQPL